MWKKLSGKKVVGEGGSRRSPEKKKKRGKGLRPVNIWSRSPQRRREVVEPKAKGGGDGGCLKMQTAKAVGQKKRKTTDTSRKQGIKEKKDGGDRPNTVARVRGQRHEALLRARIESKKKEGGGGGTK